VNTLISTAQWLADNIFGQPAFLIGLVALVGLLLQNKPASVVVSGTLKTILGFLIISAGSGVLTGALGIFEPMWNTIFGIESPPVLQGTPDFLAEYGSIVALVMTFGFLLNVLLARFTKFKYIYLTGHMMFWVTLITTAILVEAIPGISKTALLIIGSLLMGVYWTLQPAYTQKFMKKITGNDQIALGHTSSSVSFLAAIIGKYIGNPEQSTEKIKLPKGLDFLKDSNVIITIVMGLLYAVGATIIYLRPDFGTNPAIQQLASKAGSQNFIIYGFLQGFQFAAGIAVILYGVRLFIGELVPAFKGIATKIAPNAVPALDCPVVFPYAPTATIIGFLSAFVTALLWLVVLGTSGAHAFVPTMIVIFFHAATAGVFGNITGGVRGAIAGGIITSTVVALGQWWMVGALAHTVPDTVLWAADSDMFIFGFILSSVAKLFAGI
jgi:PTS system sugar-specific permease component.